MAADGVPALLLPYQLASAGVTDATSVGMIALVGLGLAALAQPLGGLVGDRLGRTPLIVVGGTVAVGGLMLMAGAPAIEHILIGFVLTMLGISVAQAGQQALLPDFVAGRRRGAASGAKNAFDVGGALIAFGVLAALLAGGDAFASVAVLSVALVVTLFLGRLLLVGMRREASTPVEKPSSGGIDREFVMLVVARFLFLLGVYVVGRFLFVLVASSIGGTPEAVGEAAGFALLVLAGVTVLASLPAGLLADRVRRRSLMLGGGLIGAIGIAALPFAGELEMLLAAGILIAIGSAAFSAASWAALADATAGPAAGRLLGIANLGTVGAAALAGLFGPLIDGASAIAPGLGFVVAFGLAAVFAAAGGIMGWRLRGEPRIGLCSEAQPLAEARV